MPLFQTSAATAHDIQPFYGYVDTTEDALRLIEAARRGILPRVTRRLNELERRSMIKTGAIFVFSVEESGIKRWTEGLAWSQSRISGNFLIYREVTDRSTLRSSNLTIETSEARTGSHPTDGHVTLKPNGLIKKTITVKINGSDHHLISYYTQEDVRSGRLHRPTSRPDLMALKITPELLQSANFRYPLKLETQYSLTPPNSDDNDEIDYQPKEASPTSPSVRTSGRSARLGQRVPHISTADLPTFPRDQSISPTIPYPSQGRHNQLHNAYSPPLQAALGHPMSPSGTTAPGQPQFSGSMNAHSMEQISPASWPSPYHQDSFPVSGSGPAMYHSAVQLGQLHNSGVRNESWTQHQTNATRFGRGPDPGIARIDVGVHSDLSWSQGVPVIAEQQLASAPATTTSISDHFPQGRGRDHMRTRSFPPVWQWDHESASPQYQLPPSPNAVYSPHGMHHSPN